MDYQPSWSFRVKVISIILRISAYWQEGSVTPYSAIDFEGIALTDDRSVKGTSVFISALSANDAGIVSQQTAILSIGKAVVSKDASRIRDISSDSKRALAGIVVTLYLTKDQFSELRDGLALNPQLPTSFEFRCVGGELKVETTFGPSRLALKDEDQELRVASYSLGIKVSKLGHEEVRAVREYAEASDDPI